MPIGAAIGSAVGAGASIIGNVIGAKAQTKAAQTATNAQLKMFDTAKSGLSPYMDEGADAMASLTKLITPNGGVDMSTLEGLPGYQFDLTQGLKAVQNSASARGLGVSGAAEKGAARFATGLADTYFGNQFSRLLGAAGVGESAAGALAGTATNTGGQIGSNIIGAGNAVGGAATGSGNAIGAGGSNYLNFMLMSKLFGGGVGGGAGMYGSGALSPSMAAGTGFGGVY